MPARDYKIVVSGLGGKVYITKVSKTNPNLMLSDRAIVDDSTILQLIEEFAKYKLEKGANVMECRLESGRLIYEVRFPNEKTDAKKKKYRDAAITALELTKGLTPEQREQATNAFNTMEEFAGYILELTN